MQDRLESQTRAIASLEEKCDSLQSNVEQLNSSLEISSSVEADLRAEIQGLQKSLSDCTFTSQSTSDRIKQVNLLHGSWLFLCGRINEIFHAFPVAKNAEQ